MTKRLSRNPNLEHYRKQAKGLLKAYRAGDVVACRRLRENLPEWSKASNTAILKGTVSLKDTLRLVAIEHGFTAWAEMKSEIAVRRVRSLPTFRSIAPDDPERKIDTIMRHVARMHEKWAARLQGAETVYTALRFGPGGHIASIVCHAARSRIKASEVQPSSEIARWRFHGVENGDEVFLGKTMSLNDTLLKHPSGTVRRLAKEHFADLQAGRATNEKLEALLGALE
jgi:hypothetical protein